MIAPETHAQRRRLLAEAVDGPILLMGNGDRPRNLPMSPVTFRQDSSFLYFTGCHHPGAALLMVDGKAVLYLPEHAEDDALWHGTVHSIEEMGAELGFSQVRPSQCLEQDAEHLNDIATIAIPDLSQNLRASALTGSQLSFGGSNGHDGLIDAIIGMRRRLSEEELDQMRTTAIVTEAAHRAAMAATRPGVHEQIVAATFQDVVVRNGLTLAYPSIVTVQGEVLHNFNYVNTTKAGQLLLLDGGAEANSGYATDVTRTWPVSGQFEPRQLAAYEAVLAAELSGIEKVRAGTRYRDVHMESSLVIAHFLADEGLVKCSAEDAVESGAHALFFPHGIGHLLGLDVHDMENFGDRASYPPDRTRSSQFGTGYLRLDLDLEPGNVVTIEPGFYVVPAILNDPALREQFSGLVDFDKAEAWHGFGGIRIEDDVAVTTGDPEVITGRIPKAVNELLDAVGG